MQAISRTFFYILLILLTFSTQYAYALVPSKSVLIIGDSLSAAYGLPREAGWVELLSQQLDGTYKGRYRVVNASISGETTSGGLQRLPDLLALHKPSVIVIELGGNDALRGLALSHTENNLNAMVKLIKASPYRTEILLIPMKMPPNYGMTYTKSFENIYPNIAKKQRTALAPFILKDFADRPEYFQKDRIHPTATAQPLMLKTVWPSLKPLLK